MIEPSRPFWLRPLLMMLVAALVVLALACGSGNDGVGVADSVALIEAEDTSSTGSAHGEPIDGGDAPTAAAALDEVPALEADAAEGRGAPPPTEDTAVTPSAPATGAAEEGRDAPPPNEDPAIAVSAPVTGADTDPDSTSVPAAAESGGATPETAAESGIAAPEPSGGEPSAAADDPGSGTDGVDASDAGGGNSAPIAVGEIPAQFLPGGQLTQVQLDRYFDDADGDELTFSATSSDVGVVTAETSIASLLIEGVSHGSAMVTVTARDGGGLTAEHTFEVTAEPSVASLELAGARTLRVAGEMSVLTVTAVISDGSRQAVDSAEVEWRSSDAAVVAVSEGTLTAVGNGTAWITATYSQRPVTVPVFVRIPAMVRVLYAVPSDRDFRTDHSDAIRRAILDVQSWYGRQLDGLTFLLHDTVPEHCRMSEPSDHYSRYSWERVVGSVQPCAPAREGSSHSVWVIYADVVDECGPYELGFDRLGRGGSGMTILAREDLQGLVDEDKNHYSCGNGVLSGPEDPPLGRWIGGVAHELGHAFNLSHPPGCDEFLETCDERALMGYGWFTYPNTYLRSDDKEILVRSAFFS